MKRLLTIIMVASALCAGATVADAQVGLELGYVNSVQRLRPEKGDLIKTPQSGFYIGLDYAVPLFAGLKIAPGIQYTYLAGVSRFPVGDAVTPQLPDHAETLSGMTHTSVDGPTPDKNPESVEHYLSIPIDLSYTFDFGRFFGLTAFVTPTLNCGLTSDLKMGNTSTDMYKVFEEMFGEKDAYSRVDFVLGVGLAADFGSHFRIRCSYDFGMLDRLNIPKNSLHHNQLKVGLGLMF